MSTTAATAPGAKTHEPLYTGAEWDFGTLRRIHDACEEIALGEDGARLAKRHGALSVGELRDRGADPRAVVGLLAASLGLAPEGARVTPRELVRGFSLERLARAPTVIASREVEALVA